MADSCCLLPDPKKEGAFLKNERIHSTRLGVVGAYLIFLAYQLFEKRADADASLPPALRIVFIAFFGLAGAAVIVYAFLVWKKSPKEDGQKQPRKDDENTLK